MIDTPGSVRPSIAASTTKSLKIFYSYNLYRSNHLEYSTRHMEKYHFAELVHELSPFD